MHLWTWYGQASRNSRYGSSPLFHDVLSISSTCSMVMSSIRASSCKVGKSGPYSTRMLPSLDSMPWYLWRYLRCMVSVGGGLSSVKCRSRFSHLGWSFGRSMEISKFGLLLRGASGDKTARSLTMDQGQRSPWSSHIRSLLNLLKRSMAGRNPVHAEIEWSIDDDSELVGSLAFSSAS